MELGWGHSSGQPLASTLTASSGSALVAIAQVAATARVRATPRVWPALDVAFGPVLLGLASNVVTPGQMRPITGLAGGAGSVRLGVDFAL
jgi:hypothetical protein